ncbi:hypothetical protein ACLOJK_038146 [Asimina triloba]
MILLGHMFPRHYVKPLQFLCISSSDEEEKRPWTPQAKRAAPTTTPMVKATCSHDSSLALLSCASSPALQTPFPFFISFFPCGELLWGSNSPSAHCSSYQNLFMLAAAAEVTARENALGT